MGLPVAAVDVGDIRAMLPEQDRRFVTPRDAEDALLASFAALCGDAGLRRELGLRNRARAIAQFERGRMIEQYRAVIQRTLGEPGTGRPAPLPQQLQNGVAQ